MSVAPHVVVKIGLRPFFSNNESFNSFTIFFASVNLFIAIL